MQTDKVRIVHVEDRFHPDMGYQLNFTAKFHCSEIDMHIITSESLKLWSHDKSLTAEVIRDKDRAFEKKHGIHIHRLPVKYEKKHGYNMLMSGVVDKIYELKPDVLFIHAIESYTAFLLLNKRKLYRDFLVCCDTHTLYNQFSNSLIEQVYFSLLKNIVISKIKRHKTPVFYTASENREILINQYGINSKNVYPYLIGTDNNVFYPYPEAGDQLRRELSISRDNKVILYAGKFNYPKSPHLLVDALKIVEQEFPESVLVMVGGKNEEYFNEHFKEDSPFKNIQLKVLDAVNTSQLNGYYNMADVVVFPKENTLSALDCQLTETPVVMEEDMTNSERLQKGGLTYKSGSLDDLGEKIKTLLNNDSLRKTLGAEGRQFISDNYSYKNIVSDVEDVIIRLLNTDSQIS